MLVCNQPIEQFDICLQSINVCDNYISHVSNGIPSKIMASKNSLKLNELSNPFYATTDDVYIPRFIGMVATNQIHDLPKTMPKDGAKTDNFMEITVTDPQAQYHSYPSMCTAWQGLANTLKVETSLVSLCNCFSFSFLAATQRYFLIVIFCIRLFDV